MAKKKPKPQGPGDRKIADCVVDKFKKCVDDAILEGKSAESAIEGCKKNITTFRLLCQGGSSSGGGTVAAAKKRRAKPTAPSTKRAKRIKQ